MTRQVCVFSEKRPFKAKVLPFFANRCRSLSAAKRVTDGGRCAEGASGLTDKKKCLGIFEFVFAVLKSWLDLVKSIIPYDALLLISMTYLFHQLTKLLLEIKQLLVQLMLTVNGQV